MFIKEESVKVKLKKGVRTMKEVIKSSLFWDYDSLRKKSKRSYEQLEKAINMAKCSACIINLAKAN